MILLKREEFYISWLSFLIVASLFSTGLHYFYGKNIYFIAAWGIQILMLLFFHSKIKQGSRKSLLFYPFSGIISIFFLIKLIIPYLTYTIDDFLKKTDSFILKHDVSFYLKTYIPDDFKIFFGGSFILFLLSIILVFFYYSLKVSLYKTQRFFNGFFSLMGISFILMLFFPLKEKNIILSNIHHYNFLKNINYEIFIHSFSLFCGSIISIAFYIFLSLIRDNKFYSFLFLPIMAFLYFSLFYLNISYISYFITNLFIALLFFYMIGDGFKKFSYNT